MKLNWIGFSRSSSCCCRRFFALISANDKKSHLLWAQSKQRQLGLWSSPSTQNNNKQKRTFSTWVSEKKLPLFLFLLSCPFHKHGFETGELICLNYLLFVFVSFFSILSRKKLQHQYCTMLFVRIPVNFIWFLNHRNVISKKKIFSMACFVSLHYCGWSLPCNPAFELWPKHRGKCLTEKKANKPHESREKIE